MTDKVDSAPLAQPVPLTDREAEVAELFASGLTNAEIAERLQITFATAKWHVSQVLSKLGLEHRNEVPDHLRRLREHRETRSRRRWAAFGLVSFPFAKGLGVAAAAVPVLAVSVGAALVFAARGDAGSNTAPGPPLAAMVATPTRGVPSPVNVIRPTRQPHTCDWQYGQAHVNDGPLDHSGCDLSAVDFGAAMFNSAILSGATLEGAVLRGATLYQADLSNANLRGAWFIEAVMGSTNFDGADLTGAHFTTSIVGGTFRGATCPDGESADSKPLGTCMGSRGLENLPETRSFAGIQSLVGSPAPQFALPGARDPDATIAGPEQGRPVLLWWFADWCGRCVAQVDGLRRFVAERPEVLVVGLSMDDSPAAALAFINAHGLDIPVAMDSRLEAAKAYNVVASATLVSITTSGAIQSVGNYSGWATSAFPGFLDRIP